CKDDCDFERRPSAMMDNSAETLPITEENDIAWDDAHTVVSNPISLEDIWVWSVAHIFAIVTFSLASLGMAIFARHSWPAVAASAIALTFFASELALLAVWLVWGGMKFVWRLPIVGLGYS